LEKPIHEDHQREWFIQGSLHLNQIPLTQQSIATLGEALEQAMNIEAMIGYPRILQVTRPPEDNNNVQPQCHISASAEKI
jgi:hypothetical protein